MEAATAMIAFFGPRRALQIAILLAGTLKADVPTPKHQSVRCNLAHLLLAEGSTKAYSMAQTALAAREKALSPDHLWTINSARVTAGVLDAPGRAADAAELREKVPN
jgi:hypothetical protein